ncbi:MAG: hypothetical protein OJJ54_24995 [Pseudonocardia sp.]|nr:hypothetical protein [Pseudonocardia sp.]
MRYIAPGRSNAALDRLVANTRPADNLLPGDVVKLIAEGTKLRVKAAEAAALARDLGTPAAEKAAQAADDAAAAKAAREGKPLPKPTAVPKLHQDREDAARTVTALETALTAVRYELDEAARAAAPDRDVELRTRAAARAQIEKAAAALADMVQAEVDRQGLGGWLNGAALDRGAVQTYWLDVIPELGSRAIGRDTHSGVGIRDVITRAAVTALDPEEV